jgi:hypothetical protein
MTTDKATADIVAQADLVVTGAPLLGFALPTDAMRASIAKDTGSGYPSPPDVDHPSIRSWLDALPKGSGKAASFETRIWWSPGSAAKTMLKMMNAAGYETADEPAKFIVTGRFGPLKDGEIERAKAWGESLRS